MIKLKRVYDPPSPDDGARYLVERLWPRGVTKDALRIDGWLKEVAPSDALRRWFGHDPRKWEQFRQRYFDELDANPDAWEPLRKAARSRVTLVYSAHDREHNNAVALKDYLEGGTAARRRKTAALQKTLLLARSPGADTKRRLLPARSRDLPRG